LNQLSLAGDLWSYLRLRKKFWPLPILIILVDLGFVLVFASTSALAPFIYSLY